VKGSLSDNSNCDAPCKGNSSEICGGTSKLMFIHTRVLSFSQC
jgi:hypothetical protein